MSDGLDITHGGAIAVDTESLRDTARRMDAVAVRLDDAQHALARAHRIIVDAPGFAARVDTGALWASGAEAGTLHDECREAADGTRLMADVYEYVELEAEADALAVTDAAAADALRLRLEGLAASDERIPLMAQMLLASWEDGRFEGLDAQFDFGGALTPFFLGAAVAGSTLGFGRLRPGAALTGTADPVTVTPVHTRTPAAPPASLADALRRLPTAPGAQVAVEKYTMPDGRATFVAYLKGTQSPGYGGANPWDLKSNVELYSGATSASYQATLDALAAAGARPGDEVDIVAHSQSGMIAAHLAMESDFDVRVQITAGSPVEPTLDADQTLVQLRHTDDLVSALAGGGSPAGTGSPDSITVCRVDDTVLGPHDAWDPHMMESYIETAELAAASGDPRVEALDDLWTRLGQAELIESTEYVARRR